MQCIYLYFDLYKRYSASSADAVSSDALSANMHHHMHHQATMCAPYLQRDQNFRWSQSDEILKNCEKWKDESPQASALHRTDARR